jgi:hypothetical protein
VEVEEEKPFYETETKPEFMNDLEQYIWDYSSRKARSAYIMVGLTI